MTGDLERNWGWLEPGVDWRNLGLTPQFDVTAELAARMWAARTGQQVDGVLAVDVAGLRQILDGHRPGPGRPAMTVDADNVEQYLLHDQYAGLSDNSAGTRPRRTRSVPSPTAVLRQLQGQSTDLRTLASAVAGAVAGRHLMVWSSDPTTQAAWVAERRERHPDADLAGRDRGQPGRQQARPVPAGVGARVHPARRRRTPTVTLTTTLDNRTPDGQSQFIAGPYPGLPLVYGDYSGDRGRQPARRRPEHHHDRRRTVVGRGAEGPTWLVAAPLVVHQGGRPRWSSGSVCRRPTASMTVVPSARIPAEQWTSGGRPFTDDRSQTISLVSSHPSAE